MRLSFLIGLVLVEMSLAWIFLTAGAQARPFRRPPAVERLLTGPLITPHDLLHYEGDRLVTLSIDDLTAAKARWTIRF